MNLVDDSIGFRLQIGNLIGNILLNVFEFLFGIVNFVLKSL